MDMEKNAKILSADLSALTVIRYPDPRLREVCSPVDEVDDRVQALVEKMFELMFASKGVGLAAPQVGVTVTLFVASPSFDPADRRVYINPRILASQGSQDDDEGCLSFPGIGCKIKRANVITIRALGLDGQEFEETGEGLTARIFQHESDHLEGRLLIDRMGSVAKLANRRAIRHLEEQYAPAP